MHHDTVVFLLSLAVLLGVARGMGDICQRFRIPSVAGELAAGLVLGKTVLGRLAPGAYAWLLLMVAGLEIDLRAVRQSGRVVLLTGLFGVAIPSLLGIGLGTLLPDSTLADPSAPA